MKNLIRILITLFLFTSINCGATDYKGLRHKRIHNKTVNIKPYRTYNISAGRRYQAKSMAEQIAMDINAQQLRSRERFFRSRQNPNKWHNRIAPHWTNK